MLSSTITPEHVHGEILKAYGQSEVACVNALGDWLISIDRAHEPPLISLIEVDTDIGFVLDGVSVAIKQYGHAEPFEFFIDPQTEQLAVQSLNRLFGS